MGCEIQVNNLVQGHENPDEGEEGSEGPTHVDLQFSREIGNRVSLAGANIPRYEAVKTPRKSLLIHGKILPIYLQQ